MTIDFDTYQSKTAETAIYPEAGTGSHLALAYVGLGLGEAGEVQGKIKKLLRGDRVLDGNAAGAIAAELGDVLWYVSRLAAELNIPLSAIARANLSKLEGRKAAGTIKGDGDVR